MHIGNLVKKVAERKNISVSSLSAQLGMHRTNLYRVFKHKNIDTAMLLQLCDVLNYDFFKAISEHLNMDNCNNEVSVKITLPESKLSQLLHHLPDNTRTINS